MPSLISTLVIVLSIAATGKETNWSMFSLSVYFLPIKLLFHITFNFISFSELLASPRNQKVSFKNVYLTVLGIQLTFVTVSSGYILNNNIIFNPHFFFTALETVASPSNDKEGDIKIFWGKFSR